MKRHRKLPTSNSGAIADVSFLLLIFFMVVTTFNKDYKLSMSLPPYAPVQAAGQVNGERLLNILINAQNQIMVNEQNVDTKMVSTISKNINTIITKGLKPIVIIKMHPSTDYQAYIEVLAKINAAKNELRLELSEQIYKEDYAAIPLENKRQIEKLLKIQISEQEIKI